MQIKSHLNPHVNIPEKNFFIFFNECSFFAPHVSSFFYILLIFSYQQFPTFNLGFLNFMDRILIDCFADINQKIRTAKKKSGISSALFSFFSFPLTSAETRPKHTPHARRALPPLRRCGYIHPKQEASGLLR